MAILPTGIDLLPSGMFRWRIKVRGVMYSGVHETLKGAVAAREQKRRDELDRAIVSGAVTLSSRTVTVQGLVDHWRAEVKHAPTTAEERDRAIATIPADFMARRAASVTPPVVAALWREMTRAKVGPHTIKRAQKALSGAWKRGIADGLATVNPIRSVTYVVDQSAPIDPPPPATVKRILAAAAVTPATKYTPAVERPDLALWLRIMATIGTRPSELCALEWDAVNIKARTIRVGPTSDRKGRQGDGKNDRAGWRTVEIPKALMDELRQMPRIVGVSYVFQTNHQPWGPDDVSRSFRKICERINVRGVRLYDLRHFAATQAIKAGVPIPDVAYMLGDNPATVMKTYAHATGTATAAAAVAKVLG